VFHVPQISEGPRIVDLGFSRGQISIPLDQVSMQVDYAVVNESEVERESQAEDG